MDFVDGSFMKNAQGTELYCKYWKAETDGIPRALVFISHGYAEHCSVYEHVAKALTNKGCFVFAHDHVGHGKSKGTPVLVSSLNVYVQDVLQHIDKVKEAYQDVPVFIVGHSMGGLIAMHCGLERPKDFKGMALIAPALELNPAVLTTCNRLMGNILGRVWKSAVISQLDSTLISRDEQVVKRFEEDPLVWHGGLKAGQALQLILAMDALKPRMEEITWPLLIQHGSADGLAELSGSRALNDNAASHDKTLSILQDAYHQLHNEPRGVGERCINEIADWIYDRSS